MKRLFILGILTSAAYGQLWSGVLAPARATDWTGAGVTGGIPSSSWTQCGPTIAAYNGNTDLINQAINHTGTGYTGCTANQYIKLGVGTFNLATGGSLSGGIVIKNNNVELRGSGADQTLLVFAAKAFDGCGGGHNAGICFNGDSGGQFWVSDPNFANWTAGFSAGTTVITLSTVSGIVTNQTIVGLDRCSDGNSGYPCSSNAEVDNGNWFDCDIAYNGTNGCAINGPDGGNQRLNRPQNELFQVSNVNAGTNQVTLIGSIRAPNWGSGGTPAVYTATNPIQFSGVRDLSIDVSAQTPAQGGSTGITGLYAANIWVHGVRIVQPNYSGIWCILCVHGTFEQNYIFSTNHPGSGGDIFGFNTAPASDMLIQDNICQWDETCYGNEGADTGDVIAYNFFINDYNANQGLFPSNFPHGGDRFQLFEGNVENSYNGENYHGPKIANTLFRNFITGWESCANSNVCGATPSFKGGGGNATTPVRTAAFSRYHNIVANVLGTPSISTHVYQTMGAWFEDNDIYAICSDPVNDAECVTSTMKWGNYDTFNSTTLECTAAATPIAACPGNERGNTDATYPGLASPSTTFPSSFYLSSKPAWFGSLPFPPIGPDVTSGNIGQCNGTFGPTTNNVAGQYGGVAAQAGMCTGTSLNASAWAGHVNANPAMNCALNTMGMPPDGSNSGALTFNATTCYPQTSGPSTPVFSPNGGTFTTNPSVTITCGGGATCCYTTNGGTPTAATPGTCDQNTYSTPVTIPSTLTLKAIGTEVAFTNSSVASALFTMIPLISPASLSFGNQTVNTTSGGQVITFTNNTGATITFTSVALTTGTQFAISANTCTGTLTNTSSCTTTITFTPTTAGAKSDTLTYTDSDASSPQTVSLTGTGVAGGGGNAGTMTRGTVLTQGASIVQH